MEILIVLVEYLLSIPTICLIGLLFGIAFMLLPIARRIEYRVLVKKYGKDCADEFVRRL